MENEIKDNEYIRTKKHGIFKVETIRKTTYGHLCGTTDNERVPTFTIGKGGTSEIKKDIVKHSPNLIDLIQCGDYVNGYKVVETYKDKQLSGWQVGKSKEDETWLGVVVSSKMIKEPLQEYFDNEMIKTIVTKEQFESISYKVTKM